MDRRLQQRDSKQHFPKLSQHRERHQPHLCPLHPDGRNLYGDRQPGRTDVGDGVHHLERLHGDEWPDDGDAAGLHGDVGHGTVARGDADPHPPRNPAGDGDRHRHATTGFE